MRTLDIFRTSVAGAALGFAQRALDEALKHALARPMFGKTLADLQLTQAALADMATEIDAARLQTYRAAWLRDRGGLVTKEVAMAKMTATESAQRAIDHAVQIFGGRGVVHGETLERLYRDIRALRIYEGATEVQKLIIARELLNEARNNMSETGSQILQPAGWPRPSGYSNGIVASRPPDLHRRPGRLGRAGQLRQHAARRPGEAGAENICTVLAEAQAGPEHIVRLTWYVTSRDEYLAELDNIGAAYREVMGKNFPVMSVVQVVALMEAPGESRNRSDGGVAGGASSPCAPAGDMTPTRRSGSAARMWRPPSGSNTTPAAGHVADRRRGGGRPAVLAGTGWPGHVGPTYLGAGNGSLACERGRLRHSRSAGLVRMFRARAARRHRRRGNGHPRCPERPAAARRTRPVSARPARSGSRGS